MVEGYFSTISKQQTKNLGKYSQKSSRRTRLKEECGRRLWCFGSAPGRTVGKVSPTISIIKEPNKTEVRVQNSDIAKFSTKHERYTDLGQYGDMRPKKIQEKSLEETMKR